MYTWVVSTYNRIYQLENGDASVINTQEIYLEKENQNVLASLYQTIQNIVLFHNPRVTEFGRSMYVMLVVYGLPMTKLLYLCQYLRKISTRMQLQQK